MYSYEVLHEDIAENLIRNVRNAISQHAYIFEGEAGVGAYEAARLFAAALVCEKKENAPCTVCHSCVMARADTHPDIMVIGPQKDKKNILVDQIREVVTGAYTKPYESAKKVYIIKYGDDMNEQAQNALLKVLEEPPEYAVFIILAENQESLLATIRSRCTLIKFPPVSDGKIREYVKRNFPDDIERADFLVRYALGVAGNVKKLLEQENFIPLRSAAFERLPELLSKNRLDAYRIAEFLKENKDDADLVLSFWQDFVRDIMLIQNGCRQIVANTDFLDRLINLSAKASEKTIICAQEQLLLAKTMRKRYVNLKVLALHLAFSIKLQGEKE